MLFSVVFSFLVGILSGIGIFVYAIEDKLPAFNEPARTEEPSLEEKKQESTEYDKTLGLVESAIITSEVDEQEEKKDTPTPMPTERLTPTKVITKIPTKAPTITPTKTPTPTITPTQALVLTTTPTPTQVLVINASSADINGYIDRFAGQYGVDPNTLRHIAVCESGFNPSATNGPYVGLYQFSQSAWVTYRNSIGESNLSELRLNAEEAVQTAAYVMSVGKSYIWPNCVP